MEIEPSGLADELDASDEGKETKDNFCIFGLSNWADDNATNWNEKLKEKQI